ncbi:MAG TPA: glycogen debranching protein GlgX [Candidatus Sulfotelmatobacter sp.]|nr:glycogen debranching protein GlgX [Candidatus Sulfotelmatobacter sp.]
MVIQTQPIVWPGRPYPLGATWDGEGVNFALFSEHAEAVELCLFDQAGRRELHRVRLKEQTDQVWHCYLPEARPGLIYGYRVYGPYEPNKGHRFNPHKLLLDPYAKQIVGEVKWSDSHFGYRIGHRNADLSMDRRDSGPGMLKSTVVDSAYTWGSDRAPRTPWHRSVIYEMHVRGFTIRHPRVPETLRGTYAGLATGAVIDHLLKLGVTAIELMPVHYFIDDRQLIERGLRNYWGYNTVGFFAPMSRYLSTSSINEFKTMVKTMHSAGIEVILDVVYNHTAEGNQLGPTLSFRGIDNSVYYRTLADNPRYYMDYTGTGNTLNMRHPRVLQLIMDSLRYWVLDMHVDGFRFDLAATLARELHEVDRLGAFLDIIHQDPVLSQVKLIAEPWDLGEGGYQVGKFPVGWAEWNDRYRDALRSYWKGDGGQMGELAYRITGSSDLYARSGRRPYASVNFVTAHDGFTLNDVVSYDHKHNEANGEDNRDGTDNNRSWNCGAEGPTDDPAINALRSKQKRNFIATLLLSQGVPMFLAGDEISRTQQGNNNAYCQDNEISWLNWEEASSERNLLEFVRKIIFLRHNHPVFRRRNFFQGRSIKGVGVKDILWLKPDGREMTDQEWTQEFARTLGVFLSGSAVDEIDDRGQLITDENFVLLMNAHHEEVPFCLPTVASEMSWITLIDTSSDSAKSPGTSHEAMTHYPLQPRSLVLLVERQRDQVRQDRRNGT